MRVSLGCNIEADAHSCKYPVSYVEAGRDIIPKKWQKPGFVRKPAMDSITFMDLALEHNLTTEEAAWALASDHEKTGDRALMSILLKSDVGLMIAKLRKARSAKYTVRRAKRSRLQILEEYVGTRLPCDRGPRKGLRCLMPPVIASGS